MVTAMSVSNYIEDKKTDIKVSEEDTLKQSTQSKEYRLPTQRHQNEQSKTVLHKSYYSKEKYSSKKKINLTDKILALYSTPVERTIPLIRARSVERIGRSSEDTHLHVEGRPWLENAIGQGTDKSCSALKFSRNLVNDYIKRSGVNHFASDPLARNSLNNGLIMEDKPCVLQLNVEMNTLEQIRPCHSGFAKEIDFKPGEALKVNGMILREPLKVGLTPFKNFAISARNIKPKLAPKHWWNYLNEKINKKLAPSKAITRTLANKSCKICQMNPEHRDLVKQFGNNVLHIDLKRLTQVRSKDWSSYGHYTRIHKLRYTKRCKNLTHNEEHRVEVDDDYLSVDVDSLMKIYKHNKDSEVELGNFTTSLYDEMELNGSRKCVFSRIKSDGSGNCQHSGNEVISSSVSSGTQGDDYTRLTRPATTTLRSCVCFTSRKTCFTNV